MASDSNMDPKGLSSTNSSIVDTPSSPIKQVGNIQNEEESTKSSLLRTDLDDVIEISSSYVYKKRRRRQNVVGKKKLKIHPQADFLGNRSNDEGSSNDSDIEITGSIYRDKPRRFIIRSKKIKDINGSRTTFSTEGTQISLKNKREEVVINDGLPKGLSMPRIPKERKKFKRFERTSKRVVINPSSESECEYWRYARGNSDTPTVKSKNDNDPVEKSSFLYEGEHVNLTGAVLYRDPEDSSNVNSCEQDEQIIVKAVKSKISMRTSHVNEPTQNDCLNADQDFSSGSSSEIWDISLSIPTQLAKNRPEPPDYDSSSSTYDIIRVGSAVSKEYENDLLREFEEAEREALNSAFTMPDSGILSELDIHIGKLPDLIKDENYGLSGDISEIASYDSGDELVTNSGAEPLYQSSLNETAKSHVNPITDSDYPPCDLNLDEIHESHDCVSAYFQENLNVSKKFIFQKPNPALLQEVPHLEPFYKSNTSKPISIPKTKNTLKNRKRKAGYQRKASRIFRNGRKINNNIPNEKIGIELDHPVPIVPKPVQQPNWLSLSPSHAQQVKYLPRRNQDKAFDFSDSLLNEGMKERILFLTGQSKAYECSTSSLHAQNRARCKYIFDPPHRGIEFQASKSPSSQNNPGFVKNITHTSASPSHPDPQKYHSLSSTYSISQNHSIMISSSGSSKIGLTPSQLNTVDKHDSMPHNSQLSQDKTQCQLYSDTTYNKIIPNSSQSTRLSEECIQTTYEFAVNSSQESPVYSSIQSFKDTGESQAPAVVRIMTIPRSDQNDSRIEFEHVTETINRKRIKFPGFGVDSDSDSESKVNSSISTVH